jgi:hypothetical protein
MGIKKIKHKKVRVTKEKNINKEKQYTNDRIKRDKLDKVGEIDKITEDQIRNRKIRKKK